MVRVCPSNVTSGVRSVCSNRIIISQCVFSVFESACALATRRGIDLVVNLLKLNGHVA